ncbi:winged helix-turn-helix domain-containing protein [Aeromonas veronii]|uniref:winged helix-turn-helix domain-containing protein n=1 Tax=Aeromonas veronii TaxID=654 RepID=UPI00330BC2BA|nr:helix-turn-helix domain-containing protein [Aeromonas veronii]
MLELNRVSGDLTWHGTRLARLSRSETFLLCYFIEHPGTLISQDTLLDVGWPQSVVAPNTLVVAIKKIRKTLSDTSASIETSPRRGYIFHLGETVASLITDESYTTFKKMDDECNIIDSSLAMNETILKVTDGPTPVDYEGDKVNDLSKLVILPKLSFINKSIKNAFCYFLLLFFMFSAVFVYESTQEWYCYQIRDASFCGAFRLETAQYKKISAGLIGKSGYFLYGYENDFSDLKVYKVY